MPNTTPRPQGQPQGNTPTQSTSTNQTIHLTPMLAKFKAGDSVLCPSLGNGVHRLAQSPTKTHNQNNTYLKHPNGNLVFFRYDGRLVEYSEELPVIFHNTPANRKAIATLYGVTYDTMPANTAKQGKGGV